MLRSLAETLRDRLVSVQGLADLQVEKHNRIPLLRVEAAHERAKLYGITPAAITGATTRAAQAPEAHRYRTGLTQGSAG